MKIKYLLLLKLFSFALITLIVSCQKNVGMEEAIIGDWLIMPGKDVYNIPITLRKQGYAFLKHGICENKLGYFSRESSRIFLGNTTKFKIENGLLKIFNLGTKSWDQWKIEEIKSDTLILKTADNQRQLFIKRRYEKSVKLDCDQIIVATSGCYGTCPISNTSINQDGEITYYGVKYNQKNGYYHAKTTAEQFSKIKRSFEKAGIDTLQHLYEASWTDDETISVTFLKDGKIIKTIEDYGNQSPPEFGWAYTTMRFYCQQLNLQQQNKNVIFEPAAGTSFISGSKIYRLPQSESFLLWLALNKSKKTAFRPKYRYRLTGFYPNNTIETDGQFYKVSADHSFETRDIGFNFINKHDLKKHFRPARDFELKQLPIE